MTTTTTETVTIPDALVVIAPGVQTLAAGIAADIRRAGHWQDGVEGSSGHCIVTTPSQVRHNKRHGFADTWALGTILTGTRMHGCLQPLTDWNDSTPTAVVLSRLDAIASGLVSA